MSKIDILYLTTFNKKLYEATGKKLIKSFIKTKSDGHLHCCYEQNLSNFPINHNVSYNDITQNDILKYWIYSNQDIIPPEYGGIKKDWGVKTDRTKYKRMAARWFRKIVSIAYCLYSFNCNKIIFLDSDVIFLRTLTSHIVNKIFDNNDIIFHFGQRRKGVDRGFESGVIGFNMSQKGDEFLKLVINNYLSGKFREWGQWDDSYCFERTFRDSNGKFKGKDLSPTAKSSHVVSHGELSKFLQHNKGVHTKKFKIYEK